VTSRELESVTRPSWDNLSTKTKYKSIEITSKRIQVAISSVLPFFSAIKETKGKESGWKLTLLANINRTGVKKTITIIPGGQEEVNTSKRATSVNPFQGRF